MTKAATCQRSNELGSIDSEIRDINLRLEEGQGTPAHQEERDALIFRLGMLTVQRVDAQRLRRRTLPRPGPLSRTACYSRPSPAPHACLTKFHLPSAVGEQEVDTPGSQTLDVTSASSIDKAQTNT